MRQSYDYEDQGGGLPMVYMAIGVSFFVLMILVLVVTINLDKKNKKQSIIAKKQEATQEENRKQEVDSLMGSGLVADDLNFWDMYPVEPEAEIEEPVVEEEPEVEEDPSKDGKHVEVISQDGTSEWIEINPKWKKNTYDFTNLVRKNDLLHYYSNGKQISYLGVDLSKYQKYVDFAAIQDEGIDFCMLRVGARGYETGIIQKDEKFQEFMRGAQAVGMPVGLYFFSQAVTVEEAIEEAEFVLNEIWGYKISYPIAFDMEFIENDTSRVETLTKKERTNIALAFLETIESAGYTGMLYGNKEWLLKRVDLSKFEGYDIWLSEEEDIPDYPYIYSMWQYTRQGNVYGIDGYVDLNVSFIDYSAR